MPRAGIEERECEMRVTKRVLENEVKNLREEALSSQKWLANFREHIAHQRDEIQELEQKMSLLVDKLIGWDEKEKKDA